MNLYRHHLVVLVELELGVLVELELAYLGEKKSSAGPGDGQSLITKFSSLSAERKTQTDQFFVRKKVSNEIRLIGSRKDRYHAGSVIQGWCPHYGIVVKLVPTRPHPKSHTSALSVRLFFFLIRRNKQEKTNFDRNRGLWYKFVKIYFLSS